ncbi:hypothetical protein COBT_000087 [Conglomerata obtusa]
MYSGLIVFLFGTEVIECSEQRGDVCVAISASSSHFLEQSSCSNKTDSISSAWQACAEKKINNGTIDSNEPSESQSPRTPPQKPPRKILDSKIEGRIDESEELELEAGMKKTSSQDSAISISIEPTAMPLTVDDNELKKNAAEKVSQNQAEQEELMSSQNHSPRPNPSKLTNFAFLEKFKKTRGNPDKSMGTVKTTNANQKPNQQNKLNLDSKDVSPSKEEESKSNDLDKNQDKNISHDTLSIGSSEKTTNTFKNYELFLRKWPKSTSEAEKKVFKNYKVHRTAFNIDFNRFKETIKNESRTHYTSTEAMYNLFCNYINCLTKILSDLTNTQIPEVETDYVPDPELSNKFNNEFMPVFNDCSKKFEESVCLYNALYTQFNHDKFGLMFLLHHKSKFPTAWDRIKDSLQKTATDRSNFCSELRTGIFSENQAENNINDIK